MAHISTTAAGNLDPLAAIEAERQAALKAIDDRYAAALEQRKAEVLKIVDALELFRLDDAVILGALRPAIEASRANDSATLGRLAAAGADFRDQAGIAGRRRGRPAGNSAGARGSNPGSSGSAASQADPGQPVLPGEAGDGAPGN